MGYIKSRYGINFTGKRIWDCQLVEYVLSNQENSYPSLNATSEYYDLGSKLDEVKENYWKNGIDTDKVPKDILSDYLKQDVELTEKVMYKQMERLNQLPHLKRLVSLHNQDLLVLEDMEYNGMTYDYDKSKILGDELELQIDKLNNRLANYHSYDNFNPNSGEHLSAFLYGGNIKERFQRPIGHFKTGSRTGEVKYRWEERDKEFTRRINPLPNTELKKEGFFSTNEETLRKLKPKTNEGSLHRHFEIDSIEFIPVLKIIGFLYFAICSINGKLLHSPEPILYPTTFIFSNLLAEARENGVER